MTQTSRLVLEIDSRDAEQKAADVRKALDALESAGLRVKPAMDKAGSGIEGAGKSAGKAADSIDDLTNSAGKAANSTQKIGETAAQAQARLVAMAKSSLEASDYVRSLSASTEKAGATFDVTADKARNLAELVKRLKAESDANVGVSTRQAEAVKKAAGATGEHAAELEKVLNKMSPGRKALAGYNQDLLTLTKGFKSGKLSANEYQVELEKVNARIRKVGGNGSAFDKLNLGTRQAQENVMQLANALQSGDIGSGARAIAQIGAGAGASAAGLLSMLAPIALVTGAVAGLGAAYYQGSKEQDAFMVAIVTTGNAAGTSTAALGSLARKVSDSTGTVGAASAVLAQLASSAKIPASSFEMIATAALKMEDATGKAASQTVADFERLAKDPVKYSKELNDQLGYLTAGTYAQIAALAEQGNQQGAANLAEKAYAEAMSSRADLIKSKLGLVESAWDGIKNAAKGAWDAALDIGREDTFEQKLVKLEDRLQRVRNASVAPIMFDDNPNLIELGAGESGAQAAITDLHVQKSEDDRRLAAKKAINDATKASIDAQESLNAALKASDPAAKKLAERYAQIEKQVEAARIKGVFYSEEQVKQLRDAAAKQYADPKLPKPKAYSEDAGLKLLDSARQTQAVLLQQNSSLSAQGIATERVGAQAQALIRWEQQLADIKGKKTLTADQKSLLTSQDLITAQLKKNAAIEKESYLRKNAADEIRQSQQDQVKLLTLTGQLRAANTLKSSIDDAAQMAEYERQGNTEAMKRLETLIKIRDINLQASQKPGTVEGVSEAPQVTGLDAVVGGAYSELDRLNAESAKVDTWRTMELQKQQAYLDLKVINDQKYADRAANINQQANERQARVEIAKNSAILSASSDFFGNMAVLSQSGNKKMAAIGKAAAIAQATISTYDSANKAYAALAGIPVIGPALGAAAAGAAIAAGLANVANIAGIGFSSGGYTGPGGVNEVAGTVHKGEVVWSQKDIQRFGGVAAVESLRNGNVSAIPARVSGSTSGGAVQAMSSAPPQIKIYVSGDGSGGSVSSTEGYEQMGQAVLATVRSEMPKVARAVIQQEKGQNGLLDPSNRRNAA